MELVKLFLFKFFRGLCLALVGVLFYVTPEVLYALCDVHFTNGKKVILSGAGLFMIGFGMIMLWNSFKYGEHEMKNKEDDKKDRE